MNYFQFWVIDPDMPRLGKQLALFGKMLGENSYRCETYEAPVSWRPTKTWCFKVSSDVHDVETMRAMFFMAGLDAHLLDEPKDPRVSDKQTKLKQMMDLMQANPSYFKPGALWYDSKSDALRYAMPVTQSISSKEKKDEDPSEV